MKLMIMIMMVSGALLGLCAASDVLAGSLRCNREQTFCQADAQHLTVGDRVGIFNRYEELVAYGEVDKIEDGVRSVKIAKSTGRIPANSRLALLEDNSTQDLGEHYKIYHEPTKTAVGADLGMASLGIGQGAPAIIGEAYGQYRWRYGILFVGRGMGFTSSGQASSLSGDALDTATYNVTGIGLLPGLAYRLGQHSDVALRFEGDLGLSYLSTTVNGGASSDVADYITSVKPGVGLIARGGVSAMMMNMDAWHPTLTGSVTQIQGARAMGLSAGILRELN